MRTPLKLLLLAPAFLVLAAPSHPEYVCTMDVKLCPDGETYVGRQGPNCKFAPCPGEGAPFKDVTSDHPNADAIFYVKAQGIVEGYANGTYRPDATINRAEFVKILVETVGADGTGPSQCFTDFDSRGFAYAEWYYGYACEAKNKRLIDGYPDGTFRGDATINVAEASKILANSIFGRTEMEFEVTHPEPWYAQAIFQLTSNHYVPVSIRSPAQLLTRGEMAEMIYRWKTDAFDKPSPTYEELVK